MSTIAGLTKVKDVDWSEVFNIWRVNEAYNQDWLGHLKSRGFSTWDEWRQYFADQFHLAECIWAIYRIDDPAVTVPTFYGGPFRGWQEQYYGGTQPVTFGALADNPKLQQNGRVNLFVENFPTGTIVTGLIENGRVVIVEGMHRCCAASLRAKRGTMNAVMYIALAEAVQPLPETVHGQKS